MKLDERIRGRTVALIEKGEKVLATNRPNPPNFIGFPTLDTQEYANWQSQSLAFLVDLLGEKHTYTKKFRKSTEEAGYRESALAGIGILQAVLGDIEQGYIETIRQLITAEVFSDFFDRAEHLLESEYVAPAAMLAGAVLENGLRSIARRVGVPVKDSDNLSSLSQKLADKSVFSRLVQGKVSVWTKIRNAADHGRFNDITKNDVTEFIKGARSLLGDKL